MYDWANSAFSTTVVTVFLGPYLTAIAESAADAGGNVYPFGLEVAAGSLFSYVLSVSVALQFLLLPILGALADYTRRKKTLFSAFAYIGALSTVGMYFLQGTDYVLGAILFIVANFSFGASIVMYNAFLNELAAVEKRDSMSSIGFATGYIGGGVLLGLNLVLLSFSESLGITTGHAVRISLASAGVWWAIFTLFPVIGIRSRRPRKNLSSGENIFTVGFKELGATFRQARRFPETIKFLLAYLFYNDGVQAVIGLSAIFAVNSLGMNNEVLVPVILGVQFVAFFGATGFNFVASKIGAKKTIAISLLIWMVALGFTYQFVDSDRMFFIAAGAIALVLGGTQALSRSLYSKLIPAGREAEYFSLYEVSERGTSWLGPLLFGLTYQFSRSYDLAILSLIVFFIAGFIILITVNVDKGIEKIKNYDKR